MVKDISHLEFTLPRQARMVKEIETTSVYDWIRQVGST